MSIDYFLINFSFFFIKELNEHILGIKNECILNIDMLNDSEVDIYYDIEKNNNFMVLNPKGIIKRKKYLSVFILLSKLSPSIINDTMIMNSYFKHLQKNIVIYICIHIYFPISLSIHFLIYMHIYNHSTL